MAEYHYNQASGTYHRKRYQLAPKLSIGGSDACGGDSGAPLVTWIKMKGRVGYRAFLIGIVSRGGRCAYLDEPGIYTRLVVYP